MWIAVYRVRDVSSCRYSSDGRWCDIFLFRAATGGTAAFGGYFVELLRFVGGC